MKGSLFVLEGIDGSGKTTAYRNLLAQAAADDISLTGTTFPNYDSHTGRLITDYLNGIFGAAASDVNPYAAASFYAADRFVSFRTDPWGDQYRRGGAVLSARYTTSNAVHQAAKLPQAEWHDFFAWLSDYEFQKLRLPAPDAVFFLDLPAELAAAQIQRRAEASDSTADIHERDFAYLSACAHAAQAAADYFGWIRIPVTENGVLRSIEENSAALYDVFRRFHPPS